jgi:hypothetical protein
VIPVEETYVFTFGYDHVHPLTKESLADCYVVVPGDRETSRKRVLTQFENKWAFQYDDDSIPKQYHMREIKWIDTVMKDD